MKFEKIEAKLSGIPFISKGNARYLYDLIIENGISDILELGIAHGTATCYMAAALSARGGGKITAVDLKAVKNSFNPSAEHQVDTFGFSDFVEVHRMKTGYTWFLHDEIQRATKDGICVPRYDLCIIDGPKNWTIDGAAFFMADKLLRDGGWLIFDDYSWTYANADTRRDSTDGITHRSLSDAELKTPQIKSVFDLLVKQHPDYSEFSIINNDWAVARKIKTHVQKTSMIVRHEETFMTLQSRIINKCKKIVKKYIMPHKSQKRNADH